MKLKNMLIIDHKRKTCKLIIIIILEIFQINNQDNLFKNKKKGTQAIGFFMTKKAE